MVVNLWQSKKPLTSVGTQCEQVEMVQRYRYPRGSYHQQTGLNTEAMCKRGQSRLHLLSICRDRPIGLCGGVLARQHHDGAGRQDKQTGEAGSVAGLSLDSMEALTEGTMRTKLKSILHNESHLLYDELLQLRSIFSLTHPPKVQHGVL